LTMLLDLGLPKIVLINNWRLRLWYNITFVLAAFTVIILCVGVEAWTSLNKMSSRVHAQLWAEEHTNTDRFVAAYRDVVSRKDNLCEKHGLYDYQLDEAGQWMYVNHTCVKICEPEVANADCYLGPELVREDHGHVFFATEMHETIFKTDTPGSKMKSSRYWVPLEDAYHVHLGYSYNVPQHEVRSMNNLWTAEGFSGTSSADTLTVILDVAGKPQKKVTPNGGGVPLSLKELLHFAGRTNWLNEAQKELGRNRKHGAAVPEGPVGRLTGIQINLRIRCHNAANVPRSLGADGWHGAVCTAQVEPTVPNWVWERATHERGGHTRHVLYHGVLVRVETEGALRIFDLKAMLVFLVESVVLLSLPASVFRFIATSCLGHLSRLYEGVLNQRFSLSQHVASTAMHLISSSVTFKKLSDTEDGISLSKMTRATADVLRDFSELSTAELNAFVLFSFTVALDVRNNRYTNYSKMHDMTVRAAEKMRQTRIFSRSGQTISGYPGTADPFDSVIYKRINAASFLVAYSIQQMVAVDHIVKLFSKERKVGILERYFLPSFVRERVLDAQSFVQGDMSPEASAISLAKETSMSQSIFPSGYLPKEHSMSSDSSLPSSLMHGKLSFSQNSDMLTTDGQGSVQNCIIPRYEQLFHETLTHLQALQHVICTNGLHEQVSAAIQDCRGAGLSTLDLIRRVQSEEAITVNSLSCRSVVNLSHGHPGCQEHASKHGAPRAPHTTISRVRKPDGDNKCSQLDEDLSTDVCTDIYPEVAEV